MSPLIPRLLPHLDAGSFRLHRFWTPQTTKILERRENRIAATSASPLLFALTYLPHHLRSEETNNKITFNDLHLDMYRLAWQLRPTPKVPKAQRHAILAPRSSGKSTTCFLAIPMWMLAHRHIKFAVAYAASAEQAHRHLSTFRRELASNELLRYDFPELCTPRRMRNQIESDRESFYIAESDVAFAADGITTATLGRKHRSTRPQLQVYDDVEQGEETYTAAMAEKRRTTILHDLLPQNLSARVLFVGTSTIADGVMHQIARRDPWVVSEQIQVHHYKPWVDDEEGNHVRTMWPAVWTPKVLADAAKDVRGWAKNWENIPLPGDGKFWGDGDIRVAPVAYLRPPDYCVLSIDPAVTSTKRSDYFGLSVVRFWQPGEGEPEVFEVAHASQASGSASDVAIKARALADLHGVATVLVETNQGGTLWANHFTFPGRRYQTIHQVESKAVRAERALSEYQAGKVVHAAVFPELVTQMLSFGAPALLHDDVADSVISGVLFIRRAEVRRTAQGSLVYRR